VGKLFGKARGAIPTEYPGKRNRQTAGFGGLLARLSGGHPRERSHVGFASVRCVGVRHTSGQFSIREDGAFAAFPLWPDGSAGAKVQSGLGAQSTRPMQSIGRYLLFGEIAAGGMATVHLGRMTGAAGFSRTVAIKRLHPTFAKDAEFVAMFLDEGRLAARIRHPNVIPTLDVVATEDEVFLVMEYVQGESLARLRRATAMLDKPTDARIVAAVMSGVLHGLHAAHEATDEQGNVLGIVHRDVSPQNILVGVDGAARLLDFGVAKAAGRAQTTQDGHVKGKLAYMPPEQLNSGFVTRRTDVYAAAVVTWEALTGQRLFHGDSQGAVITSVFKKHVIPPSAASSNVPASFDRVVMRGLERDPGLRYATAREMAMDLERCVGVASASEVGMWVESLVGSELMKRTALVSEVESAFSAHAPVQIRWPTGGHVPTRPDADASTAPWAASQVSVASAVAVRLRSRRRGAAIAWTGAGAILAGLVLLFAADRGPPRMATRIRSSPPATLLSDAPPSRAAPPGDSAARDPAPSVAPSEPPKAGPNASPEAPVNTANAVNQGTPGPRAYAHTQLTRSACDPPFTIDDKGHKHYKVACLR
jgi:serine/threonine protein kinase